MDTSSSGTGSAGHEQLRRLRLRSGLSQQELAERAGISVRTLRNLERGGVERPHAASVGRLAEALGVNANDLTALLGHVAVAAQPRGDSSSARTGSLSQPPGADSADTQGQVQGRLRIGVLGPLLVHRGSVPVELSSATQRNLLSLLAVQPRQTVGTGQIIEALWEHDPPRTSLQLIHSHVAQLRRLLEPERGARSPGRVLRHVPGGYRLELEPEQLDLWWFQELAARARQAWSTGAAESASQLFREASAYWRGPVLADADARLRLHPAMVAIARQRIAVLTEWADVAISLARFDLVLAPLQTLCAEEPLHEGLAARLMLALAGDGQQAAALALYGTVRRLLDDQLGVTPGAELQAAQLRVLRGKLPVATRPTLGADRSARPAASQPTDAENPDPDPGHRAAPPAQLPTDIQGFTGRAAGLSSLDYLLPAEEAEAPHGWLAMIAGMGGVGKTALAVHWAHRNSGRFPDGQLYVNLRGHSAEGPLRPLDALAGFLLSFGVPADRIPADETQAAAMYRSQLSGKRVLIVLDNATSAEQVRPLLPAGPGVAVIVTSREVLTGLIAREGARLLSLDALASAESTALLTRMLGTARAEAEPEAVAALAWLCANLPLALRIAAANLATRPRYRIADYAARLATGDRLTALAIDGDADTAVRATFELSCAALPVAERRLFRLLGLVAVPDFTGASAAALAGVPVAEADRLLGRLVGHHLVEEHLPGRYTLHDLLRLYAAELADREEEADGRRAATTRIADYYRARVSGAALLLYPHVLLPPGLEPAALAATTGRQPTDAAAALAWLETERPNIVAMVVHLAEHGDQRGAWELAVLINGYFASCANAVDWRVVSEVALTAARALGDPVAQAAAELHLGMAENARCRFEEAAGRYSRSVELAESAGWTQCHAVALNNLAGVYWAAARIEQTIERLTEALALHRLAGRRVGEAVTLANLAVAYLERRHDEPDALSRARTLADARGLLEAALALHRETGDSRNEADTLRVLAEVERDAGELLSAAENAQRALTLAHASEDARFRAGALSALATIRIRLGDGPAGLALHREAADLARTIGDPRVRAAMHLDQAASHVCLGQPHDAFIEVQDALAIGRQIGSRLVERKARRLLDLIEVRPPPGPAADADQMSPSRIA
ncbi:BTAD domain-containing putative transcriptional regulator [Actinocrinis sp.]|uniref:BTAD domain-containing putative transcriptional regulator n=1 Tax=Actinocrinis sp. TaxID=1920516 RepID=UPI002D54D138|nr:BTAD domain-containing putative transcriptional regulator [Actinocrinis sp.]HZP51960.1 BTAD domain-containing putative transcriptional regulator [Actinocrinis sp.]